MNRLALLLTLVVVAPAIAQREFGFDNTKSSGQPYLKPEETVARMKVADGFEVKLFAGEPQVTNPIAFTIDERGRVWVVECFEYPKRTPKGQMPRDRIVILEDTDGDGVCDSRKVFAEGKDFPMPFDLASGIEVGHGGVFLGAPPYLWFIENKDDKPGKFEVLLKGFGSQDTHETLNTFQWGPDGWLYGLHGVFTHSEVGPVQADGPTTRMNAAVWRYHPKLRKFEVFAEGTSNPWGMDWRNTDGEFILCCCVIPHLFHVVPGGVYRRQAGQSFNPYAYGEIKEICDHTFHRESGWAHAGLISLDVPHIPEKFRNSVIFGSIHGCSIKQNILKKNGSTFTASRGDDFLVSGDKNFRPINMKWGPNGDIFLIDWHDQNPCHQTKPDDWDYERGRVYRIQLKGTQLKKPEDIRSLSTKQLVETVMTDPNPWRWRTALRILHEVGIDPQGENVQMNFNLSDETMQVRFANLTSLVASKESKKPGFDLLTIATGPGAMRMKPLQVWSVRNGAQLDPPSKELVDRLARVAAVGGSAIVRREAASAAIRLSKAIDTWPIAMKLMLSGEDANDPILPLLDWLALEPHLIRNRDSILSFVRLNGEGNALITDYMIPRIIRRLATTGDAADLAACVDFAHQVKDAAMRQKALEGLVDATQGHMVDAPPKWNELQKELAADASGEVQRLLQRLSVTFRDPAAVKRALQFAADPKAPTAERIEAIRALGTLRPDEGAALLVKLLDESSSELQLAAIRSLGSYEGDAVAGQLLRRWEKFPPATRAEAANVLAGRKSWAKALLDAVAAKKVARQDLTDNTILRIRSFNDRGLNEQVEKVWGRFRATPKELEAVIAKMRTSLGTGPASFERGRKVFEQQCGKCHQFEGRGAQVGPPLDGAARDIEYMLANVLDPNRVIGQPYFVHVIERKNGTNEIGLLHAEDEQTLTLKAEQGVLKVIPKKEIETHTVQEKSMMPEGLAAGMSEQDFRDLIRYVMANPFIIHVTIDGKEVTTGPTGRIALPPSNEAGKAKLIAEVTAPSPMKTRLQLGGSTAMTVSLNGAKVFEGSPGADRPDVTSVEIELKAGVNRLEFDTSYKGEHAAIYARLLDPDRKLRYPEPK